MSIADAIKNKVKSIVNDGVTVTSTQGPYTTGSPFITPIAPPYAVSVTPATQTDGGKVGTSVSYNVTVKNLGFNSDGYTMSATSAWTATLFDSTCTTAQTTTPVIAAGGSVWDLKTDANLPQNYMKAFRTIVWFTGNSYPGPILPYEARLEAYLDNGGRLFLNGQDLLDQAAGTTTFVRDYLHVTWDGTETQNDKPTTQVHGVATSPVTGTTQPPAVGAVTLNHSVLGLPPFEDRITPNGGAVAAFTDDTGAPDALSFSNATYKVVFMAFAFEEYGVAADQSDLLKRVISFFGP
ncbi:MAG TPA: hypothetical protein VI056_10865 [Candidatus Limnocylindria bacterium]